MIVGSQSCTGMVSMNDSINDRDLSYDQWADMIDEAKKREAHGDLSMIAYRLLSVLLHYALKGGK